MAVPTPAAPVADAAATTASVIIVNYNGGPDLARCLRSLQRDGARHEVILVDNASTDGSADEIAASFPEVRLLRSPVNGGFGRGNNLGAAAAAGEVLLFLNPDTVVEPGWARPLLTALEDPSVGLATSKILLLRAPGQVNTFGNEIHCTGLTLCRGMDAPSNAFSRREEVPAVSGAAFAIRRDLFTALGGFDEAFFLYLEDTDLSLRARLAGYRCVAVPESVVYHDYALRFGPEKTFYQERNRYRLLLKTFRWRTLVALAPALILAEAVTWGFVLLRERRRRGNKLRAYLATARSWRQLMAERQRIQAGRRVEDRIILTAWTDRLSFEQTGVGVAVSLAHWLFDPLFRAARSLALTLVRW